ncbi:hypothetical protein ACFOHS_18735 [Jhaorihella thermophila]
MKKALAQLKAQNARKPKPPAPPPPKERKEATVDAFRHFTHVFSQAVYGAAYGDPKGYTEYLDPSPTNADLGRALRAALAASRFITPRPSRVGRRCAPADRRRDQGAGKRPETPRRCENQ